MVAQLSPQLLRLMQPAALAVSAWYEGDRIVGRRETSPSSLTRVADIIQAVAVAEMALAFLPSDNGLRLAILAKCQEMLSNASPDGLPWNTFAGSDPTARVYTTGRVALDLGTHLPSLVPSDVLVRAYGGLKRYIIEGDQLTHPSNIPFLYRSAIALMNADQLSSNECHYVGRVAQGHIHRFISLHALGSKSHVDPSLLCLAISLDARCSNNPLSQRERTRCLSIIFKEYEPLPTVSRSTFVMSASNVIGCSAFEALLSLLEGPSVRSLMRDHLDSLAQSLHWLEEHSSVVDDLPAGAARLFWSDLWPQYGSYDAWFNALVLRYFHAIDLFANELEQDELRQTFRASKPSPPFSYNSIACGGYRWPTLVRDKFLSKVAAAGMTSKDTGNGIVLFGPTGTGKSSIARAVAAELRDWNFVKLSSADFLANGPDRLFGAIRRIFEQLKRFRKCVVLFDEMELLVLKRDDSRADWTTGIITNIMLPELQELHDCPYVVPIFATNFISRFEKAGRRPGRFDYVLPVGPPSKSERNVLIKAHVSADKCFGDIADISDKGTVQEILEWARLYAAESRSPDASLAQRLWRQTFTPSSERTDELRTFEQEVQDYTYPPAAREVL